MNKKNFKAFLAVLLSVVMVFAIVPMTVSAADPAATISFADKANRVSQDSNQQVWKQNGITVTNNKASSTSNIIDSGDPVRFYAGSEVIIAFPGMKQVKIACNSTTYATNCKNSISDANATVSVDQKIVTIVFNEAVDSFTISSLSAQVRVDEISVYTTVDSGDEGDPEAPKPTTPEEIVNAAYELEVGATLAGGPYTLTGVITKVDTAYSTQYQNVTVTIQVGDMADKPIQCFRLKGEGADVIKVGDTITVTGQLMNYVKNDVSTIEFEAGCTLDSYVASKPDEPEAPKPTTPEEIVNAAYALEGGTMLAGGPYTLTGVITKVDTAYSTQYKNVTVTIQVGDMADKPIQCFRLKGEGADVIKVGDTITVTGQLMNYVKNDVSTIEFDAGCTLDSYVVSKPDEPDAPKPTTPEEIVNAAYALEGGTTLAGGPYTLTGVITKVDTAYSESYKNVTVTIQVGDMAEKPIQCFRLKGEGADVIKVGDTITVTGQLMNYVKNDVSTIEFDAGCTLDSYTPATPKPAPTGDMTVVLISAVVLAGAALVLVSRKRRFN